MTLCTFLGEYCARRDLASASVEQLRWAIHSLDKHAGKHVRLAELSRDLLHGWIEARIAGGISRIHVARQRGSVLALWREAAEMGLAPLVPKVRPVKVRTPAPVAYWPDELRALLTAIDSLPGAFACGVPRRLLMHALVLVGYYSGLRPSDLRLLRRGDITPTGRLVVVVSKTGRVHDCQLPPDALAAVDATWPDRRRLLFPLSRRTLCFWWRVARQRAGVGGTAKWLRRSGATAVEAQQPGSAARFLGHSTPGLAARHYVDPRQVGQDRPVPPPIG